MLKIIVVAASDQENMVLFMNMSESYSPVPPPREDKRSSREKCNLNLGRKMSSIRMFHCIICYSDVSLYYLLFHSSTFVPILDIVVNL